jgi:peroxiredoxin
MMRTTILALMIAAAPAAWAAEPLSLGSSAPMADAKMKNVDGSMVSIADARGEKGTLVVFTCNHCPYVKAWESRIDALGNAYLAKGIGVIAINANDPKVQPEDAFDAMKARAAEKGRKYPYVVDDTSDVARAFGATKTPEAFLFDASGKLVYHGTIDDNVQEPEKVTATWLADALEAVAAGNAPTTQTTKALGCSIKFRSKS